MKRFIVYILSAITITSVWSCKKQERRVIFEGGTAPVLTSSVSDTVPLSDATKSNEALTLSWTNPNYQFNTGLSSLDVNYNIEIDGSGSNFTNPNTTGNPISIGTDLSKTFTQKELNDYLSNKLQLQPGVSHNLAFRVISMLSGGAVPLNSNTINLMATPFVTPPKVDTPYTSHLYLVGDATAGGWNNPVPVPSQEFTRVSSTLYKITVPLIGGFQFLFIPKNGDWTNKYACENTSSQPTSGGDFGYNGNNNQFNANFPGPAGSGTYTITVDFQRGVYTIQ
jgi:hypothetical protein